jgi:hypothetical protein
VVAGLVALIVRSLTRTQLRLESLERVTKIDALLHCVELAKNVPSCRDFCFELAETLLERAHVADHYQPPIFAT